MDDDDDDEILVLMSVLHLIKLDHTNSGRQRTWKNIGLWGFCVFFLFENLPKSNEIGT